ncbi:hypothetical protein [Xenophilus sp. Marseille-Q4582]|uniref:hypothetical protein n=1 Tax=Xenophilus sp. Marseille-Q4582 TaxID=2866600 RepID=UPI001CE416D7|nr:hypothetical protein [Xenophilus sp. Marseille-Q4582]
MSGPFYAGMDSADAIENLNKLHDRVTEQIAGTSTTSLTIGTGPQSLNVGPDKQFAVGQVVRIADNADPVNNWMQGAVTGYDRDTGALDVEVTDTGGSGTHADWTVSLSGGVGPAGPEGPEGQAGPVGPPNSLSIGTVTSGPSAGATITGAAPSQTLNLVLPKGDKGDKGDPGADGDDGAAATITVGTVTTGAPGSSASVTNAGTSVAAVLDFVIPRGDKGDKGDKGDTGDTGAAGADGADGWAPILATVADGARYVHQVADWTGGTGTKPATGDYIGPTGLVSDIASAVNIRGAAGAGSGDVSGPAGATDGHVALFDGATGKLLKDGGALGTAAAADTADFATASQGALAATAVQPSDLAAVATSGAYADLTGKPTIPAAQQQTDWNATSGITSIANKPAVIAAGADQASARAAIGAGTSNLTIGTTSTTAKAGDYQPTIPNQATAEAGTDNTQYMTPLRTAQAIAALSLPDAPSDGKQYARKDGAWDEIAASGGAVRMVTEYLTSGTAATWVAPTNIVGGRVRARLQGPGSGSGRHASGNLCNPGGHGGYCESVVDVTPGAGYTYTVGVGGVSASAADATGAAGTNTTMFGMVAGTGTTTYATMPVNGATFTNGGIATGGQINIPGGDYTWRGAPDFVIYSVPPKFGGHPQVGVIAVSQQIIPSGYGTGGVSYGGSAGNRYNGRPGVIILEYLVAGDA